MTIVPKVVLFLSALLLVQGVPANAGWDSEDFQGPVAVVATTTAASRSCKHHSQITPQRKAHRNAHVTTEARFLLDERRQLSSLHGVLRC